ncbi:receptor kinase-like protein Xa21 [Manihot esculenta]|uniref:receptor kinase-like protein Xa21 n=1 Tax=Manihot esculenta TaxID=3983 RepID=UPI001CC47948|nr:receptor kinase-like protein Xa21 [Manihot esculenta]
MSSSRRTLLGFRSQWIMGAATVPVFLTLMLAKRSIEAERFFLLAVFSSNMQLSRIMIRDGVGIDQVKSLREVEDFMDRGERKWWETSLESTPSNIDAVTTGGGNKTDHLALLEFKAKIVHDPQNVMRSWNDSAHFCNWEGVVCGRKHRRVTILNLEDKGLVGSLSPYIGNMSFLRQIILRNNSLQGKIPAEVGRLFRLQAFDLYYNHVEGKIPWNLSLCSNLRLLILQNNKLEGQIPTELANLRKLWVLDLGVNYLTGGLPPSIANMSLLEMLAVPNNFLTGSIPDVLGQLSHLSSIGLPLNNFSGIIPPCMYNISSIKIFSVAINSLHGSVPSDTGILLPRLQLFELDNNYFSGSIPLSISNASELQVLTLSGNNFNGEVLVQFGLLKQLRILLLQGNNFNGGLQFIASMANCSNLIYLELSQNQFTGALPNSVANLSSNLRFLAIADNRISGSLPLGLFDLVNLPRIILQRNQITGAIPTEIGKLQKLQELFLDQNRLSGKIPSSIGNLSSLINLQLDINMLQGTIPSSLGNCRNLLRLGLSRNNLSGFIPKQLFPIASMLICWYKRQKRMQSPSSLELKSFPKLSYQKILKATDGFSTANLLGAGSFGSVYKGTLEEDGVIIAVKVLNPQRRGAAKSFKAECKVLQNIRHRNLVRTITSCSSIDFQGNDFKALVYEYMPNGNLDKWLHPSSEIYVEPTEQWSLSFLQRINIAIDVGSAVDYLHHGCQKPVIHCDLKPSNILLDNEMVAHIGDFGLAKFLSQLSGPIHSSSVGVRGTIGYAAPEYGLGSDPSTSGDVYSYGILLLEMMTSKKPTDNIFVEGLNLHDFARMALPDHAVEIVDPILLQEDEEEEARLNRNEGPTQVRYGEKIECLIRMMKVGAGCSMESPQDRMAISDAVNELQSIRKYYMGARAGLSTRARS